MTGEKSGSTLLLTPAGGPRNIPRRCAPAGSVAGARDCAARDGGLARVPPQRPDPPATAPPAVEPALAGTVADAFPLAEARPARTPEQMRRLAWRVLIAAFAGWLLLA